VRTLAQSIRKRMLVGDTSICVGIIPLKETYKNLTQYCTDRPGQKIQIQRAAISEFFDTGIALVSADGDMGSMGTICAVGSGSGFR